MSHSPADRTLIDLSPGEAMHPNIKRLYEHWRALAPDRPLPGRQHIDPLNFPDLLPGIWLLQVERDPLRFRYRLAGTNIVEVAGHEVTGLYMEEAHPQIKNQPNALARYINAAKNGRPSRRKGKATLWQHKDFHLIENLLLPLAKDGETVDMILVYTQLYTG
ncbi:PAS domain-containing protein [Ferrovibrio sp.]|uniref:PAS domain-containing protein n=1 Tax=Ferrovibrio sp. TaxID=1917215 RepID=UPI0035B415D8